MKKAFVLSTCQTCHKILDEVRLDASWKIHDIKAKTITEAELRTMKKIAGSYDALFTKRSRKYRQWNLASKALTENDKRDLILKEYTFLKRPVFVWDNDIFIGSSRTTIDGLKRRLTK